MGESDPAARRFWTLQFVRLAAGICAVTGAALVGRSAQPHLLGVMLLLGGALGFFLLPRLLARRWKNPKE
ncbi:MAG: hypothetical protein ACR2FJ_06515 [Qipengyuania sp.]